MTLTLSRRVFVAAGASLLVARPSLAQTTHEIQMLNKHPEDPKLRQVFFPRIQVVQPGDTVRFLAVDKGHNSAVVRGMAPEGSDSWDGKINEEVEVVLGQPGFYGYQCTPHASVGMVGLIIVEGEGMMENLEAAQGVRQRGKARAAWEEIWAEVDAMEFATS